MSQLSPAFTTTGTINPQRSKMKMLLSLRETNRHSLKSAILPLSLLLAAGILPLTPSALKAQTDYANAFTTGSADWDVPASWMEAGRPGGNSKDTVTISSLTNTVTLSLKSDVAIARLTRSGANNLRIIPGNNTQTYTFKADEVTTSGALTFWNTSSNSSSRMLNVELGTIKVTADSVNFGSSGISNHIGAVTVTDTVTLAGGSIGFYATNSTDETTLNIKLEAVDFTSSSSVLSLNKTTNADAVGHVNFIRVGSLSGSGGAVQVDNAAAFEGAARAATLLISGTGTAETVFGGIIRDGRAENTLSLIKDGTNTQTLDGTISYTGSTTIRDGVLRLGADVAELGSTTLGFGVRDDGFGQLDILNANFAFNGTLHLTLAGMSAGTGNWALFTGAQFSMGEGNLTPQEVTSDIGVDFTLTGSIWNGGDAGNLWSFNQDTGVLSVTAIPEPGTAALLFGLAVGGLFLHARRRRRVA